MDLQSYKHIHCIGIGGIGISGVVKFLQAKGVSVSGSDVKQSMITDGCVAFGIPVSIGHAVENIPEETDLVVYTEAAPEENVERAEAARRNIPQMGHFDFLGELSKDYRTICITGTNGKSTTTAMTAAIFEAAGFDPTVFVGSIVPGWPLGNVRVGKSDWLIIEGDEYKRKMLALHPEITVITNVEMDHLDCYADLADIEAAFAQLGRQTQKTVWITMDMQHRCIYLCDGTAKIGIFGYEMMPSCFVSLAEPTPSVARYFGEGTQSLDILEPDGVMNPAKKLGTVTLHLPGEFNMMNALAAKAVSLECGISLDVICRALEKFPGIWRRFERVGTFNGAQIISDYGHHPAAIRGTLAGAREFFPNKRIVLLFEPHHHNRTRELFDDFVTSFEGADVLILSEIYGVLGRDSEEDAAMSSTLLLDAVKASSKAPKESHYAANLPEAEAVLRSVIQEGDVVIVMGAGDVDVVARNLVA
ncbi:MAG: UDP-N-acetylmuramate--L-alanine ligase [Patescibacteria group bacterium]